MSIPKVLHQVWIGPRPAPLAWMKTWREVNPDFSHRLWDADAIEAFGLRNRDVYLRFLAERLYDGAADVARAEILHRHGGVYADADSVALRPIGDAAFMQAGFFAQYELNESYPGLITNAFMGAVPGHDVLERYVEVLAQISELLPMWRVSGPGALSRVLTEGTSGDVTILPWWTFAATSLWGAEVPEGESYARHFWSTTAERWGHEKTTPYPTKAD